MNSPAEYFARFFSIGLDILSTTVDPTTGVITVQLGDSTKAVPDTDKAELWSWPGLASTPQPPTSGQTSCQTIAIRRSDHDLVIATKDTRNSSINADLDSGGETALYTAAGSSTNGRVVCRKDGKIQLLSTQEIDLGSMSPSDAIALASKVLSQLQNIVKAFNSHTHPASLAVVGGGGGTAGGVTEAPSAAMNDPSSVASALVKAE